MNNLRRYRLDPKNGNLNKNSEGELDLFDDIQQPILNMLDWNARLQAMLATVVRDRHRGILEIKHEAMNALTAEGKLLQVDDGASGDEVVLRVIDAPKGE